MAVSKLGHLDEPGRLGEAEKEPQGAAGSPQGGETREATGVEERQGGNSEWEGRGGEGSRVDSYISVLKVVA